MIMLVPHELFCTGRFPHGRYLLPVIILTWQWISLKRHGQAVQRFMTVFLKDLGAIATYLPAAGSDAYNEPSAFFGGEAIYSKIVSYGNEIPKINKGIY